MYEVQNFHQFHNQITAGVYTKYQYFAKCQVMLSTLHDKYIEILTKRKMEVLKVLLQ